VSLTREGIYSQNAFRLENGRPARFAFREFFLTLDLTLGFILLFMAEAVHIGRAAKLAGVSVDTIRFYQKLGLLQSADRSAGSTESKFTISYSCGTPRNWGSLNEVKELLALRQKHHACSEVQSMLKRKLMDVREKLKSIVRLEADLAAAFRNCNRELRLKREIKHKDCCPLLTRLDRLNSSNGNQNVSNRRKTGEK
jgi:DNA-binding transcriptional MerR regulator